MSLPWKSELLIRLGRKGCSAQVLAPWSRKVVAEARVQDAASEPLALLAVLQALRDQGQEALPRCATLLVPEEKVYTSLRPAQRSGSGGLADAKRHFEQALGRDGLLVQVVPLPGGHNALAAALEPDDLTAWRQSLADQGVALTSVQLALVHDLNAIAHHIGTQGIVALLRDEGMTVLQMEGGAVRHLSWERCDQDAARCLEQRLVACALADERDERRTLLVLCHSAAQRDEWKFRAHGHGWTLLVRDEPNIALAQEQAA